MKQLNGSLQESKEFKRNRNVLLNALPPVKHVPTLFYLTYQCPASDRLKGFVSNAANGVGYLR
jgi:hypothetical protein